jgi:hypothetical protein
VKIISRPPTAARNILVYIAASRRPMCRPRRFRDGETMNRNTSTSEYLVISRGQWDADAPPERIQKAIDDFYAWLGRLVDEGRMKPGQRLATGGKTVARNSVTDGPYGEAKEVIGGFWLIIARNLDEAAQIAAENPCLKCGLFYEIRPIDPVPATAYTVTNETPSAHRSSLA